MIDTRPFFRPLAQEFVQLLRQLAPDDWLRPTVARPWVVRDVVAHLVDGTMRRLSFDRDAMIPPPPPAPIGGERDFVAFINELNRSGVETFRGYSARVLTDSYELHAAALVDFFEQASLEAPARFGVSWAGEEQSPAWMDIGREFTEHWHHQMQVRDAVGAGPPSDPAWLRATLAMAVLALPHAYRDVPAERGASVAIDIHGVSGGSWKMTRGHDGWTIAAGDTRRASARVLMSDDTAWRLLFNALPPAYARRAVQASGDAALTEPLFQARSVIV